MNNKNTITYIDENNNKIACKVLFTFSSTKFNKNYVVFTPIIRKDPNSYDVMAASYKELKNGFYEGLKYDVVSQKEWDLIGKMVDNYLEEQYYVEKENEEVEEDYEN